MTTVMVMSRKRSGSSSVDPSAGANTDMPKVNSSPRPKLPGANCNIHTAPFGVAVTSVICTLLVVPMLNRFGLVLHVRPGFVASKLIDATKCLESSPTDSWKYELLRTQSSPCISNITGPALAQAMARSFGTEIGVAVFCNRVYSACGLSEPGPPAACSTRAPTPATPGAAALGPKKFWNPVPSGSDPPKNVVSTPSAPVNCGTARTSG